MIYKRKRIVVALGGNALGNTLPEQMIAVKSTAKALCDLIEEGHQVVVVHGNGPQVGMINNAMTALTHEDQAQPNTPLSVCVAMSQAYIGYDLQNALREELRKRGFMRTPVVTVVTQVRVDPEDPAFENPSKPIGKFLTKEEADFQAKAYGHVMKEDAGRLPPCGCFSQASGNRRAGCHQQSCRCQQDRHLLWRGWNPSHLRRPPSKRCFRSH